MITYLFLVNILVNIILFSSVIYLVLKDKEKNATIKDIIDFTKKENKELYTTLFNIQTKYIYALVKKYSTDEKVKSVESAKVENKIEQETGPEEILLSDMDRVPIVSGVKIKFEDENEEVPMNIESMESYQKNMDVEDNHIENSIENPIEKV